MRPVFPQLLVFSDQALLLLRLLVGLIFFYSGVQHVRDPVGRAASIGMSTQFTLFLGIVEMAGGLGVAIGVLTQLAAIGLVLVMLGAIQKKIFLWKTGFWGKLNSGWHYDLMLVAKNLVIITTGGGRYVLW
jgi:putative oxidoreductase